MAPINVLVSTFDGLCGPRTLCFPFEPTSTTDDFLHRLTYRLPSLNPDTPYRLTTTSNRSISWSNPTSLSALLPAQCTLLPLRLTVPLKGGKGGFGSQLRAAGGRMSTRKRRDNAEKATGSARNLDGRRLRTVTEAKNLAAYLAVKPGMERKEKEERRKRWEAVVEMAEKREEDMKKGIGPDKQRKGLSDEWMEAKDDASEGVRNAVAKAMKMGTSEEMKNRDGSSTATVAPIIVTAGSSNTSREGSGEGTDAEDEDEDEDVMELDDNDMARLRAEAEAGDVDAIWVMKNQLKAESPPGKRQQPRFEGFDDDDDSGTSSEDDVDDAMVKGKGKSRAHT